MSVICDWEKDKSQAYERALKIQSAFYQINDHNSPLSDKHFDYCKLLVEIHSLEDSLAEALLSSALLEE